jgi:hypothetical protein
MTFEAFLSGEDEKGSAVMSPPTCYNDFEEWDFSKSRPLFFPLIYLTT